MTAATKDDPLLQKHVSWLGGRKALEKLQDITASGALKAAGLDGTLTVRETRSGWWRWETRLGGTVLVEVRGPKGGWALNWSGQVEPLSAAKLEAGERETFRTFARDLLESGGTARQNLGQEMRDGRSWQVLRFSFPDGDYFDLFLDPGDGSCTWIRKREDTRTFWIRLGDWRLISGVRVPFEQQTFHDEPQLDTTIRWTHFKVNQGLMAAGFEPPQPRPQTALILGGAASTPWIPIDLAEGRYIFIQGKVGGLETPILLDSGANNTVMAEDFARKLGLNPAGRMHLQGASGAQQAAFVPGIAVEIGALRMPDLTVLVTDLKGVKEAMGREVPVILGKEVFNSMVVDIDYPASRLAFHAPAAYQPDPTGQPLHLLPGESGDKLIEASIEGLPPALFFLDSGSGSTVTLFKSYVEEQSLLKDRFPRSERLLRGVAGGSVVTLATLKSLTLAGFKLKNVPAEFFQEPSGAFHTHRAAGNLGAGILNRFRVALDYSRDRMYLSPVADWDRKPFCKNRVGLETDYHGTYLEVVFVAPGSPAAKAGWPVGRRITAIDHRPIGPDYLTTGEASWWCGEPGSTVTLTDGESIDHRLVFAEYY